MSCNEQFIFVSPPSFTKNQEIPMTVPEFSKKALQSRFKANQRMDIVMDDCKLLLLPGVSFRLLVLEKLLHRSKKLGSLNIDPLLLQSRLV